MGDRGEKACLAASRAATLQAASSEPAPRHHCHSFCARRGRGCGPSGA